MANEAKQKWPSMLKELKKLEAISSGSSEQFIDSIKQTPIGIERIVPGDILSFSTIWHSMTLVKLSLESKGIYVNHKPTAVKQFIEEYDDLDDGAVIMELQQLWEEWHQSSPSFIEAQQLLKRLVQVADKINESME